VKQTKSKSAKLVSQWERTVAEALKSALSERGILQTDVAERMGWSLAMLSHTLNGRRKFTAGEFIVVCKKADVKPDEVMRRALSW
jgi:transcriptional regulator with XRE-family HTH domain